MAAAVAVAAVDPAAALAAAAAEGEEEASALERTRRTLVGADTKAKAGPAEAVEVASAGAVVVAITATLCPLLLRPAAAGTAPGAVVSTMADAHLVSRADTRVTRRPMTTPGARMEAVGLQVGPAGGAARAGQRRGTGPRAIAHRALPIGVPVAQARRSRWTSPSMRATLRSSSLSSSIKRLRIWAWEVWLLRRCKCKCRCSSSR